MFREEVVEGTREEVEDDSEGFRGPATAAALTAPLTGLELGGAAPFVRVSPARSARVFRFGAGSGTENRQTLIKTLFILRTPGHFVLHRDQPWRRHHARCGGASIVVGR